MKNVFFQYLIVVGVNYLCMFAANFKKAMIDYAKESGNSGVSGESQNY